MDPHLAKNDKIMFYKYLDKAKNYFEFGCGGSTYQAAIRDNIQNIYSVDSDKEWHENVKNKLNNFSKITFLYNEMDTIKNTWGHPGPNSTKKQRLSYSNKIVNLNKSMSKNIDFILIDGRFRVACCLKSFNVINNNCLIAFDDFLNRKAYHIVLNYYDIIEKTDDNRMVILKKKTNINCIPKDVIEKYEDVCF